MRLGSLDLGFGAGRVDGDVVGGSSEGGCGKEGGDDGGGVHGDGRLCGGKV